jgi:porin
MAPGIPNEQNSISTPSPNASATNSTDNTAILPTTTTAVAGAPEGLTTTGSPGFLKQDTMTGNWGGLRESLANDGVTFAPYYIGEVFGNPSGGAAKGVIYDGLLDLPVNLDLGQMSDGALGDLTLHADALYIHGAGLSEHFVGDFSDTSNIAGYNTLRLQELWAQTWLWDKRVSIKVGNIPVDLEFFQSSSAALFINGTFGAFTLMANNIINAPVYPLASPGVRIQFIPTSNFYAMAGVFGMDNGSNPTTNNQNGTRFALNSGSGMLVMSEVGYLINQSPNDRGLQGTYRLGSFVHTADYDNWGSQAHAALGTGSLQNGGINYGVYAVMDQQLFTKADEAISFFVRSGGAPSNINFVDWYVEGGFNFTGFIPGRENDVAGIAMARSHVSSNFSDSQILQGDAPYTAETVIEATYKMQLAPWWSIQPDLQYIVTPGGEYGIDNATVVGLRTTINF